VKTIAPLLVTALLGGGCELSLDELPATTIAFLDVGDPFVDLPEGEERSLWASLALDPGDRGACIALPEDVSMTLNGVAAEWIEPGGRPRDPFSAFSPDCRPPGGSWNLIGEPAQAPFRFVVAHGGIALEAIIDESGAITACDFPDCERGFAFGL
jgi:hypothetical protein